MSYRLPPPAFFAPVATEVPPAPPPPDPPPAPSPPAPPSVRLFFLEDLPSMFVRVRACVRVPCVRVPCVHALVLPGGGRARAPRAGSTLARESARAKHSTFTTVEHARVCDVCVRAHVKVCTRQRSQKILKSSAHAGALPCARAERVLTRWA